MLPIKCWVEIGLGLIITVKVSGRAWTERAQAWVGSGLIFWDDLSSNGCADVWSSFWTAIDFDDRYRERGRLHRLL